MTWLQTFTGKKFDFLNTHESMVDLTDIAHALSTQCRFGGHSKKFYSIAEHSVLVSELLPESLKVAGLMHDAAEAYVGDLVRPLKYLPEIKPVFKKIENNIQRVIHRKFNIIVNPADEKLIKEADNMVLRIESEKILNGTLIDNWNENFPRSEAYIDVQGLKPTKARELFLEYFTHYHRKAA